MSVVINKVDIWSTLQPQYPDSGDDDEEHNDYDADGDYYHNNYYCGGSKDDVDIWSSLQPQYPDARTCPSKVINALTKENTVSKGAFQIKWRGVVHPNPQLFFDQITFFKFQRALLLAPFVIF